MKAWQKFQRGDKVRFSEEGWQQFSRARHTGFGTVKNVLSDTMIRVHPEGIKHPISMHMNFWEKVKPRGKS